jgi:broad specificity phosphatase PhoE
MRIYVVRHGESEANVGATDEVDCALTELGRRQSASIAAALAKTGVTHILTSPYRRCLETAEAIRAATGAAAELWPAVHEHHHDPFAPGEWPLPSRSEIETHWPHFTAPVDMPSSRWAAVPEDRAGQWKRINAAVRQLLDRFRREADAAVAVVSHQAPISVFVQAFCQWPNPLNVRVHVDPGSVTVLEVDAEGRRHLVRLNWQPHCI